MDMSAVSRGRTREYPGCTEAADLVMLGHPGPIGTEPDVEGLHYATGLSSEKVREDMAIELPPLDVIGCAERRNRPDDATGR
jgi:hypothetical protein